MPVLVRLRYACQVAPIPRLLALQASIHDDATSTWLRQVRVGAPINRRRGGVLVRHAQDTHTDAPLQRRPQASLPGGALPWILSHTASQCRGRPRRPACPASAAFQQAPQNGIRAAASMSGQGICTTRPSKRRAELGRGQPSSTSISTLARGTGSSAQRPPGRIPPFLPVCLPTYNSAWGIVDARRRASGRPYHL